MAVMTTQIAGCDLTQAQQGGVGQIGVWINRDESARVAPRPRLGEIDDAGRIRQFESLHFRSEFPSLQAHTHTHKHTNIHPLSAPSFARSGWKAFGRARRKYTIRSVNERFAGPLDSV